MPSLRLYSLIGAAAVAVFGFGAYLARLKRKTPEQREQLRRLDLSEHGRIVDGTVTDVQEIEQARGGPLQMLIYRYDIAGVQYEAAQDVTYLRQFIDLHSCRLGLPASIKYEPRNPSNSIVIAENWSGL